MATWRYLGSVIACFALAALCPSDVRAKCRSGNTLAPGDHVFNIDFGGVNRTFNVHVPPSYDGRTAVALVFDLHGFSGDGPGQLALSGFGPVADANNFIVVAPTGYMNSWNGDIAYGAAYDAHIDDVGAMKAIVEYLAGIANINRAKVYATGLSNGAAMSNTLACQAADTFAAVAPVSDPLDIGLATCHPIRPISVLGFHGYSDEYVPYEGGQGLGPALPAPFPSIPDTLKNWASIMKCKGAAELIAFAGRNKCEIYRQCDAGTQVGYCSLEGSHVLYSQSNLNIADYAWKFFDQFSLPVPDKDGDGVGDVDDNCVDVANADQKDSNGNCVGDACECASSAGCDDGLFCTGSESCVNGACVRGDAPCRAGQACDESLARCVDSATNPDAGTMAAAGAGGGGRAGAQGGSGTSGLARAGAAGGTSAGSAAGTGDEGVAAGASGGGGSALQAPSGKKNGCGCHVLGSARRSAAHSALLMLLGISAVLQRRSAGRRVRGLKRLGRLG
jgi:poly(3-hydroxybutyrate) depolymerase